MGLGAGGRVNPAGEADEAACWAKAGRRGRLAAAPVKRADFLMKERRDRGLSICWGVVYLFEGTGAPIQPRKVEQLR